MSTKFLLTALALFLGANVAKKGFPQLCVIIFPLHSLASKMMNGIGKPGYKISS